MKSVLEVLEEARDLVLTRTWVPRAPYEPDGETCAAVAIGTACGYRWLSTGNRPLSRVAEEVLCGALGLHPADRDDDVHEVVTRWNDRSTRAEVIAGFDKAITYERQNLGLPAQPEIERELVTT